MGLYESRSNIAKGAKDLLARWAYLKTQWNDPQASAIEKETLEPLEKAVRTAVEAMDAMKGVVSNAKRDCAASSSMEVKGP